MIDIESQSNRKANELHNRIRDLEVTRFYNIEKYNDALI